MGNGSSLDASKYIYVEVNGKEEKVYAYSFFLENIFTPEATFSKLIPVLSSKAHCKQKVQVFLLWDGAMWYVIFLNWQAPVLMSAHES